MSAMDWKPYAPALAFGDYSELYAEESYGLAIRYEDGRVDEIESGESNGMALRYLQGEETRFGHVDGFVPDLVLGLSRGLSAGLNKAALPVLNGAAPLRTHRIARSPFDIPLEQKVAILDAADRAVRALPEAKLIRQISLSYGERRKSVRCLSVRSGKASDCAEERVYIVFAVTVVAEKDGLLQTATEVAGALSGLELLDRCDPSAVALLAARRAVQKLSSPSAPTGEMPVILEAQAGGTMIHEAIGHSLEADGIQKGISPVYVGKVGTVVASEKITVHDDPTLPNRRGSFIYDDEGTPSERTVLVDRGVLKTYLYDRLTAEKDGRPSNGHGRRESYAHKPIPRMSNTLICPGPDDPQKILQSVENGLLVRRMGGGQVNPVTGDFVFEVEEGYLLEKGRIKTMVRGASLLGNGPQVLKSIDLVGSDHGWGVGTCGKDGQGVPVSDAQPTIRIPKLLIGGQ
jgi:TldD protein